MALDNAQFISELSVVDPPGTDPLNQGDDHIRTTKLAVQQSFPNVGSAVPQTGVQMAQMAIKNEVNLFTQDNTFSFLAQFNGTAGRFRAINPGDDTGALFISDIATLRWSVLRDNSDVGGDFTINRFDANGSFQGVAMRIEAATGRSRFLGITFFNAELRAFDGSAAFPAFTFELDPTMGMYRLAANILGFATAGIERFRIANQTVSQIGPNARYTISDVAAGGSKLEMGVLSDNSAFTQGRTPTGNVSYLLRGDVNGQSYVGAFTSGAKFGIRTSTPARTFHVSGEGATAMRVTGLPTSTAGLVSGDFYAKQSQLFAPTETLVAMVP